jgi:hypothetical protein
MMDSVKKALTLSAKALKLFYVLAVANIVANIVNLLLVPAPVDAEMSIGKSFAVIGISIVFALLGIFIYSGALVYVKDLIKGGAANLASFVDNGKKFFLRVLGVSVLLTLVTLGVGIIGFAILALLPQILKPVMILIMILAGISLAVLFIMPSYALVANDLGVIDSIKKGLIVGKNNFLKILGLLAIMLLIATVVLIVVTIISGILSFILRPAASFVAAIVMALYYAAVTILVAIAYMDFYLKSEQGA